MRVEVVVARYCEDLGWLCTLPGDWRVTVYDKSAGGARERIFLPGYASPDGPDGAPTWPGAVALTNVGMGDRSYLHHIVRHWGSLADRTVFLQGDPHFHVPDWLEVVQAHPDAAYLPFGMEWECDAMGRPHFGEGGLPELAEMHAVLWPGRPMPERLRWHGYSMFAVSAERLRAAATRETYAAAHDICITKRHSCALERLYDTLLGDARC